MASARPSPSSRADRQRLNSGMAGTAEHGNAVLLQAVQELGKGRLAGLILTCSRPRARLEGDSGNWGSKALPRHGIIAPKHLWTGG